MNLLDPIPDHVVMPPDFELMRVDSHSPLLPRPLKCATCGAERKKDQRDLTFKWRDTTNPDPAHTSDVVEWQCRCNDQFMLACWMAVRGLLPSQQRIGWSDMTGASQAALMWTVDYVTRAELLVRHGVGGVLRGSNGSGKSTLAALLCKSLLKANIECFMAPANRLLPNYDNWKDPESSERWRRKVLSYPMFVIDDLGREMTQPDYSASRLEAIIVLRSANNLSTIITTNLTEPELQVRYGRRAVEILNGVGQVQDFSNSEEWRANIPARDEAETRLGLSRPVVFG